MNKLSILLSILLLTFCNAGSSEENTNSTEVSIECTYSSVLHLYYEYVDTCTLKSDPGIKEPNTNIISTNACSTVRGEEKVEIFYAVSKIIRYIPKGLKQLFPKLFGLRFDNTQLKYITKEDLKQFGDTLRMFTSYLNHIEFLEIDLFIYNPEIEYVNFRLNRITYINPNIFDGLRRLTNLWLDGTAITCGFRGAASYGAIKKQIELLKKDTNACNKIENAPPFYIFWLKFQEKEECECSSESTTLATTLETTQEANDCQAEIEASEAACDDRIDLAETTCSDMIKCCQNSTAGCPAAGDLLNFYRRALGR